MNDLSTVLAERRDAAVSRATSMARTLTATNNLEQQIALEGALDDVDRYTRLAERVGTVSVRREARTYHPHADHGFMADVMAAALNDRGATDRLYRNEHEEVGVAALQQRDVGRTTALGWTTPTYLVAEAALSAVTARPLADLITRPLTQFGDSVQIGRLTTGAAASAQTADNGAIDVAGNVSVNLAVPKASVAGTILAAQQLIDQGPSAKDAILLADLAEVIDAKVEILLYSGSGAAGQPYGLLNQTGIGSVTYTDASPTAPECWPKIGGAVAASATGRQRRPTLIAMNPRRWYFFEAGLDSAGAMFLKVLPARDPQFVAYTYGCDVLLDNAIPVNLGAGSNEDRIIATRPADLYLAEGALRVRAAPTGSGAGADALSFRLTGYRDIAFSAGRYPSTTTVVSGSGLTTPAF